METTHLKIGAMTCMGCVNSVTRVLKNTPGVASAQVTLTPGQAQVQFEPSLTSVDKLKAAIIDAGYDVL